MNRLRVQPLARADAEKAAAWYEAERPGLGVAFILELDRAIEKVAEAPHSYAPLSGQVRRVLTRRFPYAVYFVFDRDEIEILAILHQARAAQAWQTRGSSGSGGGSAT